MMIEGMKLLSKKHCNVNHGMVRRNTILLQSHYRSLRLHISVVNHFASLSVTNVMKTLNTLQQMQCFHLAMQYVYMIAMLATLLLAKLTGLVIN